MLPSKKLSFKNIRALEEVSTNQIIKKNESRDVYFLTRNTQRKYTRYDRINKPPVRKANNAISPTQISLLT